MVCLGLLLAGGCTPQTKREWLTTFFDGVPPEHPAAAAGTASQAAADPRAAAMKLPPETPRFLHVPYARRQCDGCHESVFSNKLRAGANELCFTCHKTLLGEARFRHAPAETGECMICHAPHESTERFLLVRKGQEICLDCHEMSDKFSAAAHAQIAGKVCTQCHDPHKSNVRFFLKADAATLVPAAPGPALPPK